MVHESLAPEKRKNLGEEREREMKRRRRTIVVNIGLALLCRPIRIIVVFEEVLADAALEAQSDVAPSAV